MSDSKSDPVGKGISDSQQGKGHAVPSQFKNPADYQRYSDAYVTGKK